MKKLMVALVLFLMLPMFVHAANLTAGINVDGIGDLGLTRNVYNLTLYTKSDYANITVTPADGATYTMTVDGSPVTGNQVPVQEGVNKIEITVTSGSNTESWTINLTVDKTTEYDSDNPSTGAFISILEIGLVSIIGVVLYNYSKKRIMKRI